MHILTDELTDLIHKEDESAARSLLVKMSLDE